jgi:hypothetical protein
VPDIILADILSCTLCGALITYNTRPWHLKWHAKLNARMLQPRDPLLEPTDQCRNTRHTGLTDRAAEMAGVPVKVRCELDAGHRDAHRRGTLTWSEPAPGQAGSMVGLCNETLVPVMMGGPAATCHLAAGHSGWHTDGQAQWIEKL